MLAGNSYTFEYKGEVYKSYIYGSWLLIKTQPRLTTMKFTLHDMTPQKGVDAIEDMLDSYIEADDKKYLVFLKKLKKLVDECAEGHGVE
mgnify:CR=1 FL=1